MSRAPLMLDVGRIPDAHPSAAVTAFWRWAFVLIAFALDWALVAFIGWLNVPVVQAGCRLLNLTHCS